MIKLSEKILLFTKRLRAHAKSILTHEMHLQVRSKRFLFQGLLYPIQIVCFEDDKRLGYFDADLYEIGIHRDLLLDESLAIDVLKHELAHYIAYLEFGKLDHGQAFHTICQRYNFPKSIAKATHSQPIERVRTLEAKVEKLLRLAKNSSLHESQAALLKAEELMQKHNIHPSSTSEEYALTRVLKQKRSSAKQKAIAQMLKHFFVEVIFHQGKGVVYLELIGEQTHVEIAAYVAHYLDQKMEQLYTESALKGARAKNSFMHGVANGYDEQKRPLVAQRGLILANLQRALSFAYPRLSTSSSSARIDPHSHQLGAAKGRSLSVEPAILKKKLPLLGWLGL